MGNWYEVVKTIKGHPYLYLQTSWREGDKVRTKCRCIGRLDERKKKQGAGETPAKKRKTKLQRLVGGVMSAKNIKIIEEWRQLQKEQQLVCDLLDPANRGQWKAGHTLKETNAKSSVKRNLDIDAIPVKMGIIVKSRIAKRNKKGVILIETDTPWHDEPNNKQGELLHMPEASRYEDDEEASATQKYYKSLLHECGHATGMEHRLNRTSFAQYFDDHRQRILEECIAEMTARLTALRLDIMAKNTSSSADYIQNILPQVTPYEMAVKIIISGSVAASDYLMKIHKTSAG